MGLNATNQSSRKPTKLNANELGCDNVLPTFPRLSSNKVRQKSRIYGNDICLETKVVGVIAGGRIYPPSAGQSIRPLLVICLCLVRCRQRRRFATKHSVNSFVYIRSNADVQSRSTKTFCRSIRAPPDQI